MKSTLETSVGLPVPTYTRASLIRVPRSSVESVLQKKRRRRFSRRHNGRRWAIIKRFTILETRGGTKCNLNKIYDREPMIDKGQCPFHRDAEGCEIERERREARGPNEEHSDFQRESTKRLLLCKLNAVSITIRPFH